MIPQKLDCSSQLPLKCSSKWSCCHSNTSAFWVSCSTFFGLLDTVIMFDFHDILYGCHGKWLYQECRCAYICPVYQFQLRIIISDLAWYKLWLQPSLSSPLNTEGVELKSISGYFSVWRLPQNNTVNQIKWKGHLLHVHLLHSFFVMYLFSSAFWRTQVSTKLYNYTSQPSPETQHPIDPENTFHLTCFYRYNNCGIHSHIEYIYQLQHCIFWHAVIVRLWSYTECIVSCCILSVERTFEHFVTFCKTNISHSSSFT